MSDNIREQETVVAYTNDGRPYEIEMVVRGQLWRGSASESCTIIACRDIRTKRMRYFDGCMRPMVLRPTDRRKSTFIMDPAYSWEAGEFCEILAADRWKKISLNGCGLEDGCLIP